MSMQTLRQRLENATGQLAGIEAGVSVFGQGSLSSTLRQLVAELRDIAGEMEAAEQAPQSKGA